jgi:hypothetical protein
MSGEDESIDGLLARAARAAAAGNDKTAAVLCEQVARKAKEQGQPGLESAMREFAERLFPSATPAAKE